MPSMLTTCQSEVLHAQLDSERSHLLSWCDTLTGHLFRLYLITGKDDFAKALPLIRRLREETAAVDGTSLDQVQALQELGQQLNHVMCVLSDLDETQSEDEPDPKQ